MIREDHNDVLELIVAIIGRTIGRALRFIIDGFFFCLGALVAYYIFNSIFVG